MEIPVEHTRQIGQVDEVHTAKSNNLTVILLFLLSPFVALLVALKKYKASWAKNVVWFFVAFYGFTFVIISDGRDSAAYRDQLIELHNTEITFRNFSQLLYSDESRYVDVAQPVITFVVSMFTSDYRVFFALFGFIFGYFYSRNIWFLIDKSEPYIKRENIPFIIAFAFVIGFWSLNGIRMWTAAHIFFFGASQYLVDNKQKGLLIAASSILMHYSFMLPVGLLLAFTLLQNRLNLYFIFYVSSFFLAELDLAFIRENLLAILPEAFHRRVMGYTNEAYADSRAGRIRTWHVAYYGMALRWVIIVFLSLVYYKVSSLLKNSNTSLQRLLGFSFLFLGVANIFSVVPSGGRFIAVAQLFALAAIYLYIQNTRERSIVNRMIPFAIPAILFYCIIAFRMSLDSIGVLAVIGNPLIAIFGNIDTPLIDFLK